MSMMNARQKADELMAELKNPGQLFLAAIQEQSAAVAQLEDDEAELALDHLDLAEEILGRLKDFQGLTADQLLDLDFALAKTLSLRGSANRRLDRTQAALEAYTKADSLLESIKPKVFEPIPSTGWMSGLFKRGPKLNTAAIEDWHSTKGAVLMNRGVLENASDPDKALATWQLAEQHLFDNYLKQIGPLKNLEATQKVFNLWENILTVALRTNNGPLAGRVVTYAVKLYSYWLAHNLEVPEDINMAFTCVIGAVDDCTPQQREMLFTNIPKELREIVQSLLD